MGEIKFGFWFWIAIVYGIFMTIIILWSTSTPRYKRIIIKRKLWDLYETLKQKLNTHKIRDVDIRSTVWVPNYRRKEELLQIIPYIPSEKSKVSRRLHTSKGIVGLCFRENRDQLETIAPSEDFQNYMIRHWGFTKEDVQTLTQERKSYLATPIIGVGNEILGILFFDSNNPKVLGYKYIRKEIQKYIPKIREILYSKAKE